MPQSARSLRPSLYHGQVPRHHLVPQMLLRPFADDNQKLVMVSRDDPGQVTLTRVRTACAEVGFYTIPTDDVAAKCFLGVVAWPG